MSAKRDRSHDGRAFSALLTAKITPAEYVRCLQLQAEVRGRAALLNFYTDRLGRRRAYYTPIHIGRAVKA